jgi:hypothetical protein
MAVFLFLGSYEISVLKLYASEMRKKGEKNGKNFRRQKDRQIRD